MGLWLVGLPGPNSVIGVVDDGVPDHPAVIVPLIVTMFVAVFFIAAMATVAPLMVIFVTVTIGVASAPLHGGDGALLRHA